MLTPYRNKTRSRNCVADYHAVGAGLKPALFPLRDDEPVMRLMASSC